MATAEDGGATANPAATASSAGGGGAGGKFRKKPFRKQSTPYDRPPAGTSSNSRSWLEKLVVEPASKLISYGADRFFASVVRPRLALLPSPPPQPPEATDDKSEGIQGEVVYTQDGEQEPTTGEGRKPINSSSGHAAIELEQILKQKTFTRSEIIQLTELLQSRAVDNPNQKNEEPALDFGRTEHVASGHLGGNSNERIRSSAVMSTPIFNSKAFDDDIASPAELAKAYMGGRPLNASPQVLRMHSQVSRKDMGLLSDVPLAPKSPSISLTKRTSVNLAAPENGFITPRSRDGLAIYGMARTPYSRGSRINSAGASSSRPTSFVSLVKNDEKFEFRKTTLKRRSSFIDDEAGSFGPIRRIRQKHNLLAPGIHNTVHGVGIGSHTKQKQQLMGEPMQKVLKTFGENDNGNIPSTSYAHVPSQSSEMAARIFLHLEKMTPKEKSSESKAVSLQEKSSLSSPPNMLCGKAFRSTEDMLQLGLHDDHQLDDTTNAAVPHAPDSSHPRHGTVGENGASESFVPSDTLNTIMSNDSGAFLKSSRSSVGAAGSVLANGACQPPQKKRAFRMTAEEVHLQRDGVVQSNGPSPERKGLVESPLRDSELPTFEDKSPSGLNSLKSDEFSRGAVTVGERSNFNAFQPSEEIIAASPSTKPIASFDKLKEANNSPSSFSFQPKVADELPSFPSESSKMPESELVISRSLVNSISSTGFEMKIPEAEKGPLNGVSSTVPLSASAESASLTSTSANSSGSIFGSTAKPSSSTGTVFKFGASVDLPNAGSEASTDDISEVAEQISKAERNPSSGISISSQSTLATFGAAKFGNSTSGLGFSVSSTSNTPQGSLFAGAAKPLTFSAGTISEGTSAQTVSSASIPSFNMNSTISFNMNNSASFGSSFSNLQASNSSNTFGISSSLSPSDTSKFSMGTGTTSSPFKFGASSSPVSDGTVVGLSSGSTPGIFSFGLCSSTSAVGSTSGSVASPPVTSSFSSGTSNVFKFGGCSSSASSTNSVSTSASPNIFASTWQSSTSSIFGSQSTGFSFGASSVSPAYTNAAPMVFNSSTNAASGPFFSVTGASVPALSSSTLPLFGNNPPRTGFAASPGNSDQMNAEDSMVEDPVQSSSPAIPLFGQPSVSPSPPGFMFGSTAPSQANDPFMFNSQQNQVAPQNSSPFQVQASGSSEFNPVGGGFSIGSGGDKSGRKIIKINRNKHRRK